MKRIRLTTWMVAMVFVPAALAQDSVSKIPTCGVGDGVSPYDDASALLGSEQCNDYIVDLAPFQSAWGDDFTIAPLVKSSKINNVGGPAGVGFTSGFLSAHAISKDYIKDQSFVRSTYDLWTAPTLGVNNDSAKNDPGIPIVTSDLVGDQFAVAFAEFATSDSGIDHGGMIGATVNRLEAEPNRLYVHRVVGATNGCADDENTSQFGFGAIDANGNLLWRADDFNLDGGCDGNISGNNILAVDITARDCGILNSVGAPYATGNPGNYDMGAANDYVFDSGDTYNTPSMIPESVAGGGPVYIGTNFNTEYVHGSRNNVAADVAGSHLDGGVDQRGNLSYTPANFFTGSTLGTTGLLSRVNLDCPADPNDECTDTMNVWGLGVNGAVSGGPLALTLPRNGSGDVVITDNSTGATNIAGKNEFGAYQSQVAFRGGNGQVALGVDQAGRLLAAGMVKQPDDAGSDWPINYIAVARVTNPDTPTIEWTMALYNDGTTGTGGTGKPILDGPGGNIIGRLVTLDNVTGGVPFGPSISPPMIDSVGNIYAVSAVELFDDKGGTTFNSGLVRAVYDPVNFAYELDLLVTLGGDSNQDPFLSQNTGLLWDISFLGIADSNSMSSGAPFSGNISAAAHLGMDPSGLDTQDPQALGGLVLSVEVTYDSDEDGFTDDCANIMFPSTDQDYNLMIYIAAGAAQTGCPGGAFAECGDLDDNGVRDDACEWYACNAGTCEILARATQADIGGPNGTCPIDGTCDGNDRFHALNCFSNVSTQGVTPYPCEPSSPAAINVDAGSASISCILDGVCDGNDAFHALNCFSNINSVGMQPYPCSCTGPQPQAPAGELPPRDATGVTLRGPKSAQPGDLVKVEVYFDDALDAVRGYQLHLDVTGGTRGQLELVDIAVERGAILAGLPAWSAFNLESGQMVSGLDAPEGVPSEANGYLATYTYRVPKDAEGTFVVNLRYGPNAADRTFLFGANARPMDVSAITPARINVLNRHARGKRLTARD